MSRNSYSSPDFSAFGESLPCRKSWRRAHLETRCVSNQSWLNEECDMFRTYRARRRCIAADYDFGIIHLVPPRRTPANEGAAVVARGEGRDRTFWNQCSSVINLSEPWETAIKCVLCHLHMETSVSSLAALASSCSPGGDFSQHAPECPQLPLVQDLISCLNNCQSTAHDRPKVWEKTYLPLWRTDKGGDGSSCGAVDNFSRAVSSEARRKAGLACAGRASVRRGT